VPILFYFHLLVHLKYLLAILNKLDRVYLTYLILQPFLHGKEYLKRLLYDKSIYNKVKLKIINYSLKMHLFHLNLYHLLLLLKSLANNLPKHLLFLLNRESYLAHLRKGKYLAFLLNNPLPELNKKLLIHFCIRNI
jgi:hypothetical protein